MLVAGLALMTILGPAVDVAANDRPLLDEVFDGNALAQDRGQYGQWLRGFDRTANVRNAVAAELEALKQLSPSARVEEVNKFARYWSSSKGGYQEGALRLFDKLGVSEADVQAGRYDARSVADHLVQALREYDERVVIPIARKVNEALLQDPALRGKTILFLGRDATPLYLWAEAGGVPHVYLANISRQIRDAVDAGKTGDLREVLERVGLRRNQLLRDGLVIIDSGKLGKIPASTLRALVEGMTPHETYQLLRNTEIRYLESRRRSGPTVAEAAESLGGRTGTLDARARASILGKIGNIPEFSYPVPRDLQRYGNRRNKLLEWRPKLVTTSKGFAKQADGAMGFRNAAPSSPGDRISALLGLVADLDLMAQAVASRSEPRNRARGRATPIGHERAQSRRRDEPHPRASRSGSKEPSSPLAELRSLLRSASKRGDAEALDRAVKLLEDPGVRRSVLPDLVTTRRLRRVVDREGKRFSKSFHRDYTAARSAVRARR